MLTSGVFSSNRDDWSTPQAFFDRLNTEFHFDLDPCANDDNAKCAHYFTPADDGLTQEWTGNVFVNPPYGRVIGQWVKKSYSESRNGALVVMLIPARTDTRWWHDWVMKAKEVRLIRGRLSFDGKAGAPFPSAVVIFDSATEGPPRFTVMSREAS